MLSHRGFEAYNSVRCLGQRIHIRHDRCADVKAVADLHSSAFLSQNDGAPKASRDHEGSSREDTQNTGAMSRRLSEMTEETLEQGGRSARKVVDEAGFSEGLKRRLEAKIADSTFRNENSSAFAQLEMPVYSLPCRVEILQAHCGTVKCRSRHSRASGRPAMDRYRNCGRCCSENAQ